MSIAPGNHYIIIAVVYLTLNDKKKNMCKTNAKHFYIEAKMTSCFFLCFVPLASKVSV